MDASSTRLTHHVNAPRAQVYRALIDAAAVARWMVPDDMSSHVHAFDGREGGAFRISLTYTAPTEAGKTTAQTDTYHGRSPATDHRSPATGRVRFSLPLRCSR